MSTMAGPSRALLRPKDVVGLLDDLDEPIMPGSDEDIFWKNDGKFFIICICNGCKMHLL